MFGSERRVSMEGWRHGLVGYVIDVNRWCGFGK